MKNKNSAFQKPKHRGDLLEQASVDGYYSSLPRSLLKWLRSLRLLAKPQRPNHLCFLNFLITSLTNQKNKSNNMKTTTNCAIIAMIMALGLLPLLSNSQVTIGGVNLGNLPNYFLFYSDAQIDANWQGASKGYRGNVAIDGIEAFERTSG